MTVQGKAPAVPAPPAGTLEAPEGVTRHVGGSNLQAICDAYRQATGRADLCPEALRAVAQRRALSPAYVDAKLGLLHAAMSAGEVRNARGYFLAALDRNWTEQTAPKKDEGSQVDTGWEPRTPDAPDLVAALTRVGVTREAAARFVRENPEGVRRQLLWLPHRKARDPAALLVRAVTGDWPEPRDAHTDRLFQASRKDAERWAANLARAQAEATRPGSHQVGRLALAEMRRTLGFGEGGSGVGTQPTRGDLSAESLERRPHGRS